MIERLDWTPNDAIAGKDNTLSHIVNNVLVIQTNKKINFYKQSNFYLLAFEQYRGHPIERKNYLEDLRRASWKINSINENNSGDEEEKSRIVGHDSFRHQEKYKNKDFDESKEIQVETNDCDSPSRNMEEEADVLTIEEQQCITDQLLESNFGI